MDQIPSYYPNYTQYSNPQTYYPVYQPVLDQQMNMRVTELEKRCNNLEFQVSELKRMLNEVLKKK